MFKKILLATDGSEHAIRAGEKAMELASFDQHAQVDIIYVIDGKDSKEEVIDNWGKDTSQKRKEKLAFIEQKAKHANIKYDVIFLHGEPGPTIVNYANKHHYDIVIIGSRGLNTLQEMVLGSVSHKVAKRVDCPVMIVN
ncbi:universal stress protein [Lentibacillus cibarius]|uniref:Universal stress protein n=1 Tax=Lentibacillus cibarius TaxID=2583219 RepID=A0A5S3QKQ3_9BACI|nr:universal stress protein [Lentibacillus cibarius]TMN22435.1 universal stress protein [Lentibacillus cibarius]